MICSQRPRIASQNPGHQNDAQDFGILIGCNDSIFFSGADSKNYILIFYFHFEGII